MKKGFASDNNAGISQQMIEAIRQVNQDHVAGYGDDQYTQQAKALFQKEFGDDIDLYFVFNGTGANTLALTSITQPYNSILCADSGHIQVDECGAIEKSSGCKLIPVPSRDGKLFPEDIKKYLHGFGEQHHSQPGAISISQVTEVGTLYSIDEIKAISSLAHEYGLLVHMDGARLANAAVALNAPFRAFTRDAGIDVLSFGGTKNGMIMGEAVVFFRSAIAKNPVFVRKQAAQLFSKMRFISAQFLAYFENDLWKHNAETANDMAQKLAEKIKEFPQITISKPTQANGIFATVEPQLLSKMQKELFFYIWDEDRNEARWMTSFDTTEEDIDYFITTIRKLVN